MMGTAADAAVALRDACRTVPGVRVADGLDLADPPAVIVAAPELTEWAGAPLEATSARFPVFVVENADERALERLLELVPAVAAAVDELVDAVVVQATPARFPSGTGGDLPAYEITVEWAL